ncbi:unnamed protein product, partial [Protopolystoma xenopodis]
SQVDGGHDDEDDDEPDSEAESFTPAAGVSRRTDAVGSTASTPRGQRSGAGPLSGASLGGAQGNSDTDEDDDDLVPATPGLTPCHTTPRHGPRSSAHPLTPDGLLASPLTPLSVGASLTGGLSESRPNLSGSGNLATGANASVSGSRQANQSLTGRTGTQQVLVGRRIGDNGDRAAKRRFASPFPAGGKDEFDEEYEEGSEYCGDEAEIMTTTTLTPAGKGLELLSHHSFLQSK